MHRLGQWLVWAALTALVWLNIWATSNTSPFQDTWRDLYFAEQIASGSSFPLRGPVIGNITHLGPVWYYLLAPAMALGGSVAVLGFIGLLAGLKFPLAFLLGRRIGGDGFGVMLVVALLSPTWLQVEGLAATHTSVVATALLALGLSGLAYARRPSTSGAALLGLFAGLVVHAHPTTVLPGASIVLGALIWHMTYSRPLASAAGWNPAQSRPAPEAMQNGCLPFTRPLLGHGLLVVLIAVLPLLPLLFAPGADDARGLSDYVAHDLQMPGWIRPVELISGILWGAAELIYRFWLQRDGMSTEIPLLAHALGLLLAGAGLLLAVRNRRQRLAVVALVVLFVLQTVMLMHVRSIAPFYMTYAHVPLLALLLALGWRALWQQGWLPRLAICLVAAIYAMSHVAMLRFIHSPPDTVKQPTFASASRGLMDVGSRPTGSTRIASTRLPIDRLDSLGARLCEPSVVYGHFAALLDQSFGVGVRRACGAVDQVVLGGRPVAEAANWLGLAEPAARLIERPAPQVVDGLSLYRVSEVWTQAMPLSIVAGGRFPARDLSRYPATAFRIEGRAAAGDAVVLAVRNSGYAEFQVRRASANGQSQEALFVDRFLAIYRCQDCAGDASVAWSFDLTAAPALLDAVVVQADAGAGIE